MESSVSAVHHEPWNKGKIVGQKVPLKARDIWALRVRLQMESRVRKLAPAKRHTNGRSNGALLDDPIDLKQVVTQLAASRKNLRIVTAAATPLRSVQRQPKSIRSLFQQPVRYVAFHPAQWPNP
jgi:hypothetical protein